MKKQIGLTLIELMISMALGLIIIAATMNIYISSIKSSSNTLKSARLNHDLGMAVSLITNDIKRAGYWSNAILKASSLDNPFTDTTTDIHIFNLASPTTALTTTAGDCILYTYDGLFNNAAIAATASLPAVSVNTIPNGLVDSTEYYGFRLNSVVNDNNITVGVIQMRMSGATPTTADCTDGTWQPITDENMVNVTSLQFSFAPFSTVQAATTTTPEFPILFATSRCINFTQNNDITNALNCTTPTPVVNDYIAQKRIVNIRIAGQLIGTDNAEVIKGLSATVKIRNIRTYQQ